MDYQLTATIYVLFMLFIAGGTSASTKMLIFGDFGTGDKNQKLVAQDMERYCKIHGCDFSITVGDNIYPKGVENFSGLPNYQIITNVFVKNYWSLKIPFYMSFGNHDIGNEGSLSILKDFFKSQDIINKRTVTLMMNEINYTEHPDNPPVINSAKKPSRLWNFNASFYNIEEKGDVNLWAINTNTYPHGVLKSDKDFAQEKWLKDSLGKAQKWKIVFGHMPIYSHGRHGWQDFLALRNFRASIINLLCTMKVDFYLSGHDHHLEVDRHVCANGHIIIAVLIGSINGFFENSPFIKT